jgi:hypothetical protein
MVKRSSATFRADTNNRPVEHSLGGLTETDQDLAVQFQ